MPKPYSQDLRDRVIDAVKRGKMEAARAAAARRYEISRIRGDPNGLSGVELGRLARAMCQALWRSSGFKLDAVPGLSLEAARVEKIDVTLQAPCAIAFRPSEGSKPTRR